MIKNLFSATIASFRAPFIFAIVSSPWCLRLARLQASAPATTSKNFSATDDSRSSLPQIVEKLSRIEEINDYNQICDLLEAGSLNEAAEKIEEFKKKYSIIFYENRLAAIRSYLEYKDAEIAEEARQDSLDKHLQKDAFSQFSPYPEIASYCLYLWGAKQQEETHVSDFQKQVLGLQPEMLQPEVSANAFKTFKDFLHHYEKHPYAWDVEVRMKALYQRLANMRLLQACCYFEKKAYVGSANCALAVIREYPQSTAAIQSLLILAASYQQLHLEKLAEECFKVYRVNRNQLSVLTEKDSVAKWFVIAQKYSEANSSPLENEFFPLQKRLHILENRAKALEETTTRLLQQQKHTIQSSLETQKKLGVVQACARLQDLLNEWKEFQIKKEYPQMLQSKSSSPEEIFAPLLQELQHHLTQLEGYMDQEELRFKDQAVRLSRAVANTLSLPLFDKKLEQEIATLLEAVDTSKKDVAERLLLVLPIDETEKISS